MPTATRIEVAKDLEDLAHRSARWIADMASASQDRFAISLSGGSTPRRLYQLLAEAPFREAMPWDRVHWFWGDERFVPRGPSGQQLPYGARGPAGACTHPGGKHPSGRDRRRSGRGRPRL